VKSTVASCDKIKVAVSHIADRVKPVALRELEMINEHSNTFQSDLNQFVEKINKIFIDTSQETFGNII
jgi:hypothetical protein